MRLFTPRLHAVYTQIAEQMLGDFCTFEEPSTVPDGDFGYTEVYAVTATNVPCDVQTEFFGTRDQPAYDRLRGRQLLQVYVPVGTPVKADSRITRLSDGAVFEALGDPHDVTDDFLIRVGVAGATPN